MPSIVKQCYRVCERSVDERSRRSLFTHAGRRDKLPDRLSALTGVPIDQDDLSEFVCRKCASELDRYARKVAEAEDLKRNLVDKLSATTLRHRSVLKWAGKKLSMQTHRTAQVFAGSIRQRFVHFLRLHVCSFVP